tara:strand:+ start:5103 stop:5924 length:822 start_codon:yes stop_codon:yes gene_type:complete
MKNNTSICIIGGFDQLSKSYFQDVKKKYNSVYFVNLLNNTYTIENLYNYKIFQLKKILELLKLKSVTEIVFLGKLERPNLNEFKSDGIVEKYIPLLLNKYKKGDGAVLNAIIKIFKEFNYKTVSPLKFSENFTFKNNNLSNIKAKEDFIDIDKSINLLNDISKYDNAQSVVTINGYIIAIEAVEGTDALLKRVYKIRKDLNQLSSRSGFLIKIPKKNQSKLIDLPVIGPKTIKLIYKANLKGLAIDQRNTMVHRKNEVLRLINEYNLKIYNIN